METVSLHSFADELQQILEKDAGLKDFFIRKVAPESSKRLARTKVVSNITGAFPRSVKPVKPIDMGDTWLAKAGLRPA